ncbi:MAG: hypothetical protein ACHP7O_08430 [Burkholderiales bacterium]
MDSTSTIGGIASVISVIAGTVWVVFVSDLTEISFDLASSALDSVSVPAVDSAETLTPLSPQPSSDASITKIAIILVEQFPITIFLSEKSSVLIQNFTL